MIVEYPSNESLRGVRDDFELDPERGWKQKPGIRTYYNQELGRNFTVTVREDGFRATSGSPSSGLPEVLILGCSFIQGFGLDDKQTYAWKLQEQLPQFSIINLGVGGYGTLHSLITARQYLESRKPNYRGVALIYGFADFHPIRNVKSPIAQRYWNSPGMFPICDLQSCSSWQGRDMRGWWQTSRLVSLFENAWDIWSGRDAARIADEVTIRLIRDLRDLASEYGMEFFILPVSIKNEQWFKRLASESIRVLPCDNKELHSKQFRLQDGHPNHEWGTAMSECTASQL